MQDWYWYLGFSVLFILLASAVLIVWYLRRPSLPSQASVPLTGLPVETVHLKFRNIYPLSRLADPNQAIRARDQTLPWQTRMKELGQALGKKRVKQIMLLHGTFVGSDPVSVLPTLRRFFPNMAAGGLKGERIKKLVDKVTRDNGNFLPSYLQLLEDALAAQIAGHLFYWSSANHHAARLEGALRLIERIAAEKPGRANDRMLLIGHSHARQVFALFTQLLAEGELGQKIWQIVEDDRLAASDLRAKARDLAQRPFDLVTLGGPVRYPWAMLPGMRVLHIVNHAGEDAQAQSPWNFWNHRGGDFVQQWGMIGSDVLAPSAPERLVNQKLDPILGSGLNTRVWYQTMNKRNRLGDFGRTLLVDYSELDAFRKDNFVTSVFGHGIYTRFDVMLYHMELICEYLYEADLKKG